MADKPKEPDLAKLKAEHKRLAGRILAGMSGRKPGVSSTDYHRHFAIGRQIEMIEENAKKKGIKDSVDKGIKEANHAKR